MAADKELPTRYLHVASPIIVHGTWALERRATGCVYLHMQGMRYFHSIEAEANNGHRNPDGSPVLYWERCEARRMPMPDKVTIAVGTFSEQPLRLMLVLPKNYEESLDNIMFRKQ